MAIGWTVNMIAKRMGVHRSAVQRWKAGISTPRNAHRILQMLEERSPSNNHKTLLRLMSHHVEDGVYAQGYQKLADLMGVEYSYISKLCRKLSQQGLVTRLDSAPGRAARWRVNAQE
jgi:transcriptional regulator with XRE-family HTH domain